MPTPEVSSSEDKPHVSLFSDYPSHDVFVGDICAAAESPAPTKLLYSIKDSAWALSCSVRSVSYLISSGKLRVRKLGSRTLIPAEELARFAGTDHETLT